jgi:cell division protein FtsN
MFPGHLEHSEVRIMRNWVFGTVCLLAMGLFGTAMAEQYVYSIHISSYRPEQKAAAEVKNLNAKGLKAFYRFVRVKGKGDWYRVYVGSYASANAAKADIARLKQMKISDYFAVAKVEAGPARAAQAAAPAAQKPAPPPKTSAVNYYLFVGVYSDQKPARKEVDRLTRALAADGYTVILTRESKADGTTYRVYIGTFYDRQNAADAGAELTRNKTLTAFYIPVPEPQDMVAGRMAPAAAPKNTSTQAAAAGVASAAATAKAAEPAQPDQAKTAVKPGKAAKPDAGSAAADFRRFILTLKAGAFSPQNVNSFSISETDFTGTTIYRISDEVAPQLGLEGAVRFNPYIGLYGNVDTVLLEGCSWVNISGGPQLTFPAGDSLVPYIKGGAVYGNFSWDDAPGDFDPAVGWEAGLGLSFLKSKVKIGIDFNYRNIGFDYNKPSDPNVTATEDHLDMTGYALTGTLSFWF